MYEDSSGSFGRTYSELLLCGFSNIQEKTTMLLRIFAAILIAGTSSVLGNSCTSSDWFQCKTASGCIPQSRVCNGHQDCFDGSDEWGCGKFLPSLL